MALHGVYEQAAKGCGRVARRMPGWLLAPSLVDTTSRGHGGGKKPSQGPGNVTSCSSWRKGR